MPLSHQGQPKSKSKKFISFKKKKILTFQSTHAASEMAVTIGCFSIVMGVAIMLAVEDLNFLLKVIWAHPQQVTWLIFLIWTWTPFLLGILGNSLPLLSPPSAVPMPENQQTTWMKVHNDGKLSFGKRQQGQKGCQHSLKMHLHLELWFFFLHPFSPTWMWAIVLRGMYESHFYGNRDGSAQVSD